MGLGWGFDQKAVDLFEFDDILAKVDVLINDG